MSRTLQFRRYDTSVLANTVGANGEIIVDMTVDTLTVHNGVTNGGSRIASEVFVTNSINNQINFIQNGNNIVSLGNTGILTIPNVIKANSDISLISANNDTLIFDSLGDLNVPGKVNDGFGNLRISPQVLINNISDFTLSRFDSGKHLYFNTGSSSRVIIPSNIFDVGTSITLISSVTSIIYLDSSTEIVYASGFPFSANGYDISGGNVIILLYIGNNTWFVSGTGISDHL